MVLHSQRGHINCTDYTDSACNLATGFLLRHSQIILLVLKNNAALVEYWILLL